MNTVLPLQAFVQKVYIFLVSIAAQTYSEKKVHKIKEEFFPFLFLSLFYLEREGKIQQKWR